MEVQNWARSLAAAVTAVSLTTSSIASAAPAPARSLDPLVALSVFGSAQSRGAFCAATAAAVTAAAVQAAQGCVLPVVDAPPPPVVSEAVPPPPAVAAAPVSLAASTSLLPFFIGLAGLAALVVIIDRHNHGRVVFHVPGSPS